MTVIMMMMMMMLMMMMVISTTIFQNITEKLEKLHILFSQFWGFY